MKEQTNTSDSIVPEVGMGATLYHWSDRDPVRVVRVSDSGKTIWVKLVESWIVCGTVREGNVEYEYGGVLEGSDEIKVSRKMSGEWRAKGGGKVLLGRIEKFYDPHF